MKREIAGLSARYVSALRKYLKQGTHASLLAALRLGSEAVALGLATPGLARLHERALSMAGPASRKNGMLKRARFFLTLASTSLEETHPGARGHKRLEESLQLQQRLRRLTHRVLAAQEDERRKISCELQDEIAQILLGINVRLLSLKEKARSNPEGLQKEIASTRRLVVKSAQSVRQFAHELDHHQEE